jgi:hypothetical protein
MKINLSTLFLIISSVLYAQPDKEAFNSAARIATIQSYCLTCENEPPRIFNQDSLRKSYNVTTTEELLNIALYKYSSFAKEFPQSSYVTKALMQKARLEIYFNQPNEAKITFKNILEPNITDEETQFRGVNFDKSKAAYELAKFSISEGDCEQGISYLERCQSLAKFECGNDAENFVDELKNLYHQCGKELKFPK